MASWRARPTASSNWRVAATLALGLRPRSVGRAMAARMPMIAMTINNSISVKAGEGRGASTLRSAVTEDGWSVERPPSAVLLRRTGNPHSDVGRCSHSLLPAQNVVFVGPFVGRAARVDQLVGAGRPNHHRAVRFVNRAGATAFRDQSVETSHRDSGKAVKGVARFIIVVEVNGDDVRVAPGVAVGSVQANARRHLITGHVRGEVGGLLRVLDVAQVDGRHTGRIGPVFNVQERGHDFGVVGVVAHLRRINNTEESATWGAETAAGRGI